MDKNFEEAFIDGHESTEFLTALEGAFGKVHDSLDAIRRERRNKEIIKNIIAGTSGVVIAGLAALLVSKARKENHESDNN